MPRVEYTLDKKHGIVDFIISDVDPADGIGHCGMYYLECLKWVKDILSDISKALEEEKNNGKTTK